MSSITLVPFLHHHCNVYEKSRWNKIVSRAGGGRVNRGNGLRKIRPPPYISTTHPRKRRRQYEKFRCHRAGHGIYIYRGRHTHARYTLYIYIVIFMNGGRGFIARSELVRGKKGSMRRLDVAPVAGLAARGRRQVAGYVVRAIPVDSARALYTHNTRGWRQYRSPAAAVCIIHCRCSLACSVGPATRQTSPPPSL